MIFANTVNYDDSTKPKDMNWISEDTKVKTAHYKPNDMLMGNIDVDLSVAEAAFMAILLQKEVKVLFGSTNIK